MMLPGLKTSIISHTALNISIQDLANLQLHNILEILQIAVCHSEGIFLQLAVFWADFDDRHYIQILFILFTQAASKAIDSVISGVWHDNWNITFAILDKEMSSTDLLLNVW